MATIWAAIGAGRPAEITATGSPTRRPATDCETVKSTFAAWSMPWSVVSSVPSLRYCPI